MKIRLRVSKYKMREVAELRRLAVPGSSATELERLQEQVGELRREFYAHLGAWQRQQLDRWRADGRIEHSPLLWAALTCIVR